MPTSISSPLNDIRCLECDKLLATPAGIKCPRCKKVHAFEEQFATELKPDEYVVVFLWTRNGSRGSSIVIRKEVWLAFDSLDEVSKNCPQYPVFFVYNHLDLSQNLDSGVGCRVNREPILDFKEALKLARECEMAARSTGRWFDVYNITEPELQKPADGIWDFRSLERLSAANQATFDDLRVTLEDYTDGSAIIPAVVIGIIERLHLTTEHRTTLLDIARTGAAKTTKKAHAEWNELISYLSA